VPKGTLISLQSGGGGGYGPPAGRDPKAVLSDVEEGYITHEQARSDYGVEARADQQKSFGARSELMGGRNDR
jgi:N-methylhydantoinase B